MERRVTGSKEEKERNDDGGGIEKKRKEGETKWRRRKERRIDLKESGNQIEGRKEGGGKTKETM